MGRQDISTKTRGNIVGIGGQHLEAWQMDHKERIYGWGRVGFQPRAAAGRWPGQSLSRGLNSAYFSGICAWGMAAFSDLPKALERSWEVMNMWAGHTIWKCPYHWISANRGQA